MSSSRIGRMPVLLPAGVEAELKEGLLQIKGKLGTLSLNIHSFVKAEIVDNVLKFTAANQSKLAKALTGTLRALTANMVKGVHEGFEKKLQLVGVGYRAKIEGAKLVLALGYSHPIEMDIPAGLKVEVPSQTEVVVRGSDKQLVGQFSANVRAKRAPEPYKGKGVRYADEIIKRKEAKKK